MFDAMLETLIEAAERDRSADIIDSTVVGAHHCAVGLKKGVSVQDILSGVTPSVIPSPLNYLGLKQEHLATLVSGCKLAPVERAGTPSLRIEGGLSPAIE